MINSEEKKRNENKVTKAIKYKTFLTERSALKQWQKKQLPDKSIKNQQLFKLPTSQVGCKYHHINIIIKVKAYCKFFCL